MREESFITSDGLNLKTYYFFEEEDPKNIVLIVHGHGEHALRYVDWVDELKEVGVNVVAISLRGHGGSDGKRGHTPSMNQLMIDIEYFIRSVRVNHIDSNLYLYGHSMGGNVVLNYLKRDKSNEIKGSIITSPWLKLAFQPSNFQLRLGKIASKIFPTLSQHSKLEPNEISSQPEEVKKYREDDKVHDLISAKLFTEIVKYGKHLIDSADAIKHPTLLVHGELDRITDIEASKLVADRCKNISFVAFENSKHEIHHDCERLDLVKTIENWFLSI